MQKDPNPLGMNAERLAAACDAVEALFDETRGPSHVFVTQAGDQDIVIRGNTAGLVELAHYLFMVATSRTEGWHVHLDEDTLFSESDSDFNLIVGYEIEQGSWENRSG